MLPLTSASIIPKCGNPSSRVSTYKDLIPLEIVIGAKMPYLELRKNWGKYKISVSALNYSMFRVTGFNWRVDKLKYGKRTI
jgi:hypothetical protein